MPLPSRKNNHKNASVGRVALTLICNQTAQVTVTGKLTELVGKKPKQHRVTFSLGPAHGQANPGRSYQLSIKLPSAAVSALASLTPESLSLTITASNRNGKGRATVTIGGLRGVKS